MSYRCGGAAAFAVFSWAIACGTSATSDGAASSAPTDPAAASTGQPGAPSSSGSTGTPGASTGGGDLGDAATGPGAADAADAASPANDPAVVASASCAAPVPANGARALSLPAYAGACPALAVAPAVTTLTSSGAARTFIVVRPTTIAPGETLPVVFLWHWLGGSADAMASKLEVQAAVDARRFIGVLPVAKGDALFRWPFEATQTQARVDEEARFFDDMLACVGAALPVNKECVSSVGVSAGALWTGQLATLRSEHLASMVILSGGVGGVVRGWSTTPHRLPSLVLWGGPSDMYPANVPIMNFETASHSLISSLSTDGHYLMECTHNCGHAVPPFDAPAAGSGGLLFDPVWRFVLDHPYWLPASKSPYTGKALPAAYPSWCGQGAGSAVPRPNGSACN
jgi:poly(3-hydroxybutyrate) depolymerase